MAERVPAIGDIVIFHDPKGVPHNALVQCVWSPHMINVVFMSGDEAKQDQYGRQIEHATSVPHLNQSSAHGYYFRWADEPAKPYTPPLAS